MPDDQNGNHTLPAGYRATDGEIIEASQHNPPLEDLSASLSTRLSRDGRGTMRANLKMGNFRVVDAANAVDGADIPTLAQVQALIAAQPVVPPGAIQMYAGPTLPAGWLWADGSTVSRTTYAALFNAIGTTYGAGDGSTTFRLPQADGRFPRFLHRNSGLDNGRALGSLQDDSIKSHTHAATSTVNDPGHVHGSGNARNLTPSFAQPGTASGDGNTAAATTGITVSTAIADTGDIETRPVNIAFNVIIKT